MVKDGRLVLIDKEVKAERFVKGDLSELVIVCSTTASIEKVLSCDND